jgi:phosphotransferase system HPr (HPr) family protein
MARVDVEVRNPSGLHARPAASFVRAAGALDAEVRVTNLTRDAEKSASARSVLGVMALGVARGHHIRLEADGPEGEAAVAALADLVTAGLGEEVD